jgi:hypothetical protein
MNLPELIENGLISPDPTGAYTGIISGSKFRIGPGQHPETWTATVADKTVVLETDDLEHAWSQAVACAEQISFNICGPCI